MRKVRWWVKSEWEKARKPRRSVAGVARSDSSFASFLATSFSHTFTIIGHTYTHTHTQSSRYHIVRLTFKRWEARFWWIGTELRSAYVYHNWARVESVCVSVCVCVCERGWGEGGGRARLMLSPESHRWGILFSPFLKSPSFPTLTLLNIHPGFHNPTNFPSLTLKIIEFRNFPTRTWTLVNILSWSQSRERQITSLLPIQSFICLLYFFFILFFDFSSVLQ